MLKAMRLSALMVLAAALPALADTRFQIRRMTRDDVPLGKGQCDIRLQVDNEVEVHVRGDGTPARTTLTWDGFDRLVTATDAIGGQAQLTRDPVSNVIKPKRMRSRKTSRRPSADCCQVAHAAPSGS